jgi:hypothetical protein
MKSSLFERLMLRGLRRPSVMSGLWWQLIDISTMPRYTLLPKKVIQYLKSWPHEENKKNEMKPFRRYQLVLLKVIPYLRRSVVGFLPRRSGFNPRSGYMLHLRQTKWHWARFSPRTLFSVPIFILSVIFHPVLVQGVSVRAKPDICVLQ